MASLRCRGVFFRLEMRLRFSVNAIATPRENALSGFESNVPSPVTAKISVAFSSEATDIFRENGLSGFATRPPIEFPTNIPTSPLPYTSEIFRGNARCGFVAKPPILSQTRTAAAFIFKRARDLPKKGYWPSMRIHIAYQQRSSQSRLHLCAIEPFRENGLSGRVTDPRSLNSTKIPLGVFL